MLDLIGLREVCTTDFENAYDYGGDPDEHRSSDAEERAEAVPVYRLGRRFDAIVEKGCGYADLPRICPHRSRSYFYAGSEAVHMSPSDGGRSEAVPGDGLSSDSRDTPRPRYHSSSYRKTIVRAMVVAVIALTLRTQNGTDLNDDGGDNVWGRYELHRTRAPFRCDNSARKADHCRNSNLFDMVCILTQGRRAAPSAEAKVNERLAMKLELVFMQGNP